MKSNTTRLERKNAINSLNPDDFENYRDYFFAIHLNENVILMHLIGTLIGLCILPFAILKLSWILVLVYIFFFYGLGFLSHLIFDGIISRTAKEAFWKTFQYALELNFSYITGNFKKLQFDLLEKYPKVKDIYIKK